MNKNRLKYLAFLTLGAILTSATAASLSITPVEPFDKERYLGTWYEIARLPNPFEEKCQRNISAEYTLIDNQIQVLNRCELADGTEHEAEGLATFQNRSGSQLSVNFLPAWLRWLPFTDGDYWVIRLDNDYQISLVGEPSGEYLWLLARTPNLPEAVIQDYLQTAQKAGYSNIDQVIFVKNEVQASTEAQSSP